MKAKLLSKKRRFQHRKDEEDYHFRGKSLSFTTKKDKKEPFSFSTVTIQ